MGPRNRDRDLQLLPQEEGILFQPARPFWEVLKGEEAYKIRSLEDAKAWQLLHYGKNRGAAPFEHPFADDLRKGAAQVAEALKKVFRKKAKIDENFRPSMSSITIYVALKIPMTQTLLAETREALGRLLGVRFVKGRSVGERHFPDPVEGEEQSSAVLNGRKMEMSLDFARGFLAGVTITLRG
jgi:hypothetical protein